MNRIQAINVIDGCGNGPEIVELIEKLILDLYRKRGLEILRDEALSGIATKLLEATK